MKYETEELVLIVAKLAEGYTSKESSSITYERAQQFMGAVLYCLHEAEEMHAFSVTRKDGMSAQDMYAIGVSCVKEKTKETLGLYNKIMNNFSSYGNQCLYDTVVKGLPEFFKRYDCRYEPQNTILTLDYPVLVEATEHSGIDRINNFVTCIQLEQKFLNKFSKEYVVETLSKYNREYKLMIDNICEIVLMNVLTHFLQEEEIIQKGNLQELRSKLKSVVEIIVGKYYENDGKLKEYLYQAVNNISVRIMTARGL